MKIRMLKTENGSEDGLTTSTYYKGDVYEVHPSLATVFVDNGFAEYFTSAAEAEAGEKQENPVEENKMQDPVKKNKKK